MLTSLVATFVLILAKINGRILLYNTENEETVEKFDCAYYVPNYGEEIPYCRRSGQSESMNRLQNECDNQGEKILFRHLLMDEIHPSIIFQWSSSVEIIDLYTNIFYNRSLIDDEDEQFVCKCTMNGTFGKYCEYQLTHNVKTFSEVIKSQFEEKEHGDPWDTQRHGKILCYETLSCPSSPLCLDWREICDGEQRCFNGTDEENWDKLEFNECEHDEFRCRNGMCISEEFWLDGDYDCMDWSDEYYSGVDEWCSFKANSMECDEHLCVPNTYSCGDGECVSWPTRMAFHRLEVAEKDCFNKRNLNYMCEISKNQSSWTLKDGLCWPDRGYDDDRYPPWENIHSTNLTNEEKCQYLFRCVLSKGFEKDCPCNYFNCTELMKNVCTRSDYWVFYPLEGLINPNIYIAYNYTHSMENPKFQSFLFSGGLKCRGFFFQAKGLIPYSDKNDGVTWSLINRLLCTVFHPMAEDQNYSSIYQENQFCWNDSVTFNGRPYAVDPNRCPISGECISQYRIRDGTRDCYDIDDEMTNFHKNYCTGNVQQHRFQCFNNENKCLPLIQLGTSHADCLNSYDESWYGIGNELRLQLSCEKDKRTDCHRLKNYIQQSSIRNSSKNDSFFNSEDQKITDRMPFQHYCNSFWSFEKRLDEMPTSCHYWICENDQYQCRTGQCIPFQWVCDGEWDCSDASDEQAIFLINKWSDHNAQLPNLFEYIDKCRKQYSQSPFANICNISFEFGCYRSNVSNPLDIESFRPCIHLTQIGDDVEDCYNAYDEKNVFTSNRSPLDMWGFHFHCGNNPLPYTYACDRSNNCTEILCSYQRNNTESCSGTTDFICLKNTTCVKNGRCNDIIECPNGEDEYWCPSGTLNNRNKYRFDKNQMLRKINKPFLRISYPFNTTQQEISNFSNDQSFKIYSYQCNRGIAVIQKNLTKCLCPPAYYGQWCQFFNDRISVIAHFDQKNNSNITLKIQANLLFNDQTIDSHQFNIVPLLETKQMIKHKFYLLYSRSDQMLEHKRRRYINRTDVINNHPYSVHFDAFTLELNNTVKEIGSWRYPVYFDYLPAFRLAVVLKLPSWFENTTLNLCEQNNCNNNSTCLPVFNQKKTYYCSCKSGYYGKNCNMYEPFCENSCSNNGLCRIDYSNLAVKKKKSYCICPMDYFGGRCQLKLNDCHSNPCLNHGSCFPLYDRTGEYSYLCNCSEGFYGSECEQEKSSVYIHLNIITTISVRATVIQLYTYISNSLTLLIEHQELYYDLPSLVKYSHSRTHIPQLGVMKIYEDFSHAEYFLIYFLYQTEINTTLSPTYCPHASFFLSKENDQSVKAVFKYHQICQNNTEYHCFYDEDYFCICQEDHYRVECFIHDTQLDRCSKCLSGGKCLRGNLKDSNDFLCSCPFCHQGQQCQFNMQAFSFTLHSLFGNYSKQIKIIYLTIVCILFIIGLFNNICSFLTFKRSTPRKFGVGNYLFIVSCFNQISLLFLLFKFFEITVGIIDLRSCQLASYFLSVMTRSTYWLTSWISVDRLLMIILPTSSFVKNGHLSIGISIFTLIILFSMHIHEIIYYTIIQDISTGSSICVTNFNTKFISTYNRISTLIHYLVPFFIQIISITFLIVLAARSRVKTVGQKMTFTQVLKKQFASQKELYITPLIIILSALPQTIFTFSLACTQLNEWQRHTLIVSYLLSYTPQLLGFVLYVLPSTNYKKEFYQTFIGQQIAKRISNKKTTDKNILKTKTKPSD